MTEPRTPDDQPIDRASTPLGDLPAAPSTDAADSPTQAWPSLTEADTSATSPVAPLPAAPSASPYEPAESLPSTRVGTVADGGTFGAKEPSSPGRTRLRWGLALVGVLIVALGSFAIVSLVGGRPSPSIALGYMPATTVSYSEIRLDLPGDQRQKLAAFLQAFPGFQDQSAIEPKIDEVFDRIVKAASKDSQTWTADIKPWFGGQIAIGAGVPDPTASSAMAMAGSEPGLVAVTVVDRAKAIAWLTKTAKGAPFQQSTYGDADLFTVTASGSADATMSGAVAINDKVMLAGPTASVKAAIDSGGKGTFGQNDDVKAALATLNDDVVLLGIMRTRQYADAALQMIAKQSPGALDKTQIDETVLAMLPAWQVTTARFDKDAIVAGTAGPSWSIGYASANRTSQVVGHVPASAVLYLDLHDVGPNLTALLSRFRGLSEAKDAFAQLDQALSLLGGADAVYGWWGDSALVVTPVAGGAIGGGLVIHPQDAAKAERLFTTLNGFVALGGSSAGITSRTEDHNGTKITILDLSGVPGMSTTDLPAGYKAEFAWASNADVAVLGYGSDFVKAVLDAGPGASLGDDARFKGLLGRVGAENIGLSYVDIAGIRKLVEPLAKNALPADEWTHYTTDVQPYLAPLDALISGIRNGDGVDRGSGAITAH